MVPIFYSAGGATKDSSPEPWNAWCPISLRDVSSSKEIQCSPLQSEKARSPIARNLRGNLMLSRPLPSKTLSHRRLHLLINWSPSRQPLRSMRCRERHSENAKLPIWNNCGGAINSYTPEPANVYAPMVSRALPAVSTCFRA